MWARLTRKCFYLSNRVVVQLAQNSRFGNGGVAGSSPAYSTMVVSWGIQASRFGMTGRLIRTLPFYGVISSVGYERCVVVAEVIGSSPIWHPFWTHSSIGRVSRYGREGWEFEALCVHFLKINSEKFCSLEKCFYICIVMKKNANILLSLCTSWFSYLSDSKGVLCIEEDWC